MNKTDHSLHDKLLHLFDTPAPVAFVTGSAADRVGRSIARLLLHSGFRVAFHSHHGEPASVDYVQSLVAAGCPAMLCSGAVEHDGNAQRWLSEINARWGRVDLLVHAAAVWEPCPLEQLSSQQLKHDFDINTLGTFLTSQHFGLAMVAQPTGGAIIHIGDWAIARPYTDFASYFVSKGALPTMTASLAIELATRNPRVRVNAIQPGPVMLAQGTSPEREKAIVNASLLQRAGTANDIAEAALFLATSPFITGVCLPVDGGRSIYAGQATDRCAHPNWDRGNRSRNL